MGKAKKTGLILILMGVWIAVVGYLSCSYDSGWGELCIDFGTRFLPFRLILGIGVTLVFAGIGTLLFFGPTKNTETASEGDRKKLTHDIDEG